jgi:hypothetical protein
VPLGWVCGACCTLAARAVALLLPPAPSTCMRAAHLAPVLLPVPSACCRRRRCCRPHGAPQVAGEAQSFLDHIRLGIQAAARDPAALLLFSGGQTRKAAGPRSEGLSYWMAAEAAGWFGARQVRARAYTEVRTRTRSGGGVLNVLPPHLTPHLTPHCTCTTPTPHLAPLSHLTLHVFDRQEHARDSFENLLFSLCRFYELTGEQQQQQQRNEPAAAAERGSRCSKLAQAAAWATLGTPSAADGSSVWQGMAASTLTAATSLAPCVPCCCAVLDNNTHTPHTKPAHTHTPMRPGHYPARITAVSYSLKQQRFEGLHRAAVRFPAAAFHFIGTPVRGAVERLLESVAGPHADKVPHVVRPCVPPGVCLSA